MPRRWWLHLVLFLLTLLTTTTFGCALASAYSTGHAVTEESLVASYGRWLHGGSGLASGLVYSIPLLLILAAHEFGHYFACRRWNVRATLPYFGPSPTLLGTVGAIILIRSPICNRRSLLDIGASGPVAGFIVLTPFLIVGVWLSRVIPGFEANGPFSFGMPFLMRALEWIRFPGVRSADICLHPIAIAAWAGLLATAMNLLPAGQLDGGHILYALFGEHTHRTVTWISVGVLVLCGLFYRPWWLGAVVLFLVRRHPLIYDQERLGAKRSALGIAALLLLLISIAVVPVEIK